MTDDRVDSRARTRARAGRAADGASAPARRDRLVRAIRAAVSLAVVLGYVLVFGIAAGAFVRATALLEPVVGSAGQVRALGAGVALLPAATFLFVALYDDADLVRPEWEGSHPPLVDTWMLLAAVVGVATLVVYTAEVPELVVSSGAAATLVTAGFVLPFWLARRCLRRPSWMLGGLATLAVPLVGVVAALSLDEGWGHGGDPHLALVVAVVGTAVTYGLAAASPGPDALAGRLAGGVRQFLALARTVTVPRDTE